MIFPILAGLGALSLMSNPRRKRRKARRNPRSNRRTSGKAKGRPTFEQACSQYVHRFTMQHVPQWALAKRSDGSYYAPQFSTDREWYDSTTFPGEEGHLGDRDHCFTSHETWPLGKALSAPFRRNPKGKRRRNPNGSEITAHELVLFIVNDGDLYRQQTQPILKNLAKKIKKGVYDHAKAVKLWGYLADNGAQRYTKESGSGGSTSYGIFSKPIRMIAAKELQSYYQEDLDDTVKSNPRVSKTKMVYVLQGNYGYGWDDLLEEDTFKEAKAQRKVYDENERTASHRVIRRRVPKENPRRRRAHKRRK